MLPRKHYICSRNLNNNLFYCLSKIFMFVCDMFVVGVVLLLVNVCRCLFIIIVPVLALILAYAHRLDYFNRCQKYIT